MKVENCLEMRKTLRAAMLSALARSDCTGH